MDSKIKRIYVPMTESGFYILFCLQRPQHGYGISQQVKQMTGGELVISAGTMYGTLSKMEQDGLIAFVGEEEKRKLYQMTALGAEVLALELRRIERLYRNSKGEIYNDRQENTDPLFHDRGLRGRGDLAARAEQERLEADADGGPLLLHF